MTKIKIEHPPLKPLPREVRPIGPRDAKIAIVGEAPGQEETNTGVPFVGTSGQLLTSILNRAGINKSECYITNVCKYQPPGNKVARLHEIGISLHSQEMQLLEELDTIRPNVIVPLGSTALRAIVGQASISKYRGSILQYKDIKVIPSYHPAYILRQYKDIYYSIHDFIRIREQSQFPDRPRKTRNFLIRPTFEQVLDYIQKRLADGGPIALDLETNMGADYIKCVGLAHTDEDAICIPIWEGDSAVWTVEEEVTIWRWLKLLLQSPTNPKYIQNLMFECAVLRPWIGEIYPIELDTMIGHHLLLPETRKGLATLASLYTNEPYYKDDPKDSNYDSETLYEYNCKDCVVTFEVATEEMKEIADCNLNEFLYGYQMPLAEIFEWASHIGIRVDTDEVIRRRSAMELALTKAQSSLDALVGYPINIASPKQVGDLLYNRMELPKQLDRITGNITTDEEALRKLARKFPMPIFEHILEIRRLSKLISTYLKEFWEEDGRCHPSWNIAGSPQNKSAPVTGRLSSSENIRGKGLNMQNIPEELRDLFIADANCTLLKVDLSQAESWLVAFMAQDSNMMKVLSDGDDIHKLVASMVFNVPIQNLTKDSHERQIGKRLGHSANYLIGIDHFGAIAGLDRSQAKAIIERYYTIFKLREWHDSVKEKLRVDRTITTPFGRSRVFFDRWGPELFRSAIAHEPQSTACDHINRAAVRIHYRLKTGSTILLQVHDELVLNVPNCDIEYTVGVLRDELKRPIRIHERDIVIPIDISVGNNWKELSKYE